MYKPESKISKRLKKRKREDILNKLSPEERLRPRDMTFLRVCYILELTSAWNPVTSVGLVTLLTIPKRVLQGKAGINVKFLTRLCL